VKRFAALIRDIDSSTKTKNKVQALVDYFAQAPADDALWVVALFTHRRPKRSVKVSQLRAWAAEAAGIPDWLFEESYHIVGDLAETIAQVLPAPMGQSQRRLSQWFQFLKELKTCEEAEQKLRLQEAWNNLEALERFLLNKLITGGFRVGVSDKLLAQSLGQHLNMPSAEVAHRLAGNWDPFTTQWEDLFSGDALAFDRSKPYPFFLATAIEEGQEAGLGEASDFLAELKWDGIRGQLIWRQGEACLWSRGEELISDSFPELLEAIQQLKQDCVLDGEILVWDPERRAPRSFQDLQKRLGRKKPGKKMLSDNPVAFMAYDLLELNGQDLRSLAQSERRRHLETLLQDQTSIQLSAQIMANTWQELAEIRANSAELGAEGLMIKRMDSRYGVGRKAGAWYKWKREPDTVDCVMLYAQRGHGRRANLYTDFTLGVRHEGSFVPFAKAYSGLTDAEFKEINTWIKSHTRESFGPVRSVDAELVFELAFEGISYSSRHKSGVAVRFPRLVRWRKDKSVAEIATLDELKALIDLRNS
jgi:DNA ligase-1